MITVLHQTPDYLVCVKPAGLDSQRGLPDALRAQLQADPNGDRLYPVHRLDRETGGVILVARTAPAAAFFSRQMAEGAAQKTYLAVVARRPEADAGAYEDLLFHDAARNKSFVVCRPRRGVRQARLSYRVLGRVRDGWLTEVTLHTGRTHQIRVQFASRGMPLAGDRKYGGPPREQGLALWAARLRVQDPQGNALTFTAPPPSDWGEIQNFA